MASPLLGGHPIPACRLHRIGGQAEPAVIHETEVEPRLGVAAPWIVLLLLSTRPETAQAFAGPGGVTLLLGGAVLTVIAYRIMRRIGRLPTETRVFA